MFGDPVQNDMEWPTKSIKEVAPETNADIPKDNEYWWLNLDMIESYSGRLLDRVIEKADAIGNSTHPFDDSMVLYSKLRPYLNKVFVPDGYGYATTELVALQPNPSELNKYFLFNLLRGDCFVNFANKSSSGAQMPRMQMKVLREFQCILPPMNLQNEFVEISKQADKSKFTGFKSQFIEMFTDTPKGKISDIATITMGQSPDGKTYNTDGNGMCFYQGKTEFGDLYIGEATTWTTAPSRIAEANYVLMSVRAPVGSTNIATQTCCLGRGLAGIRPIEGKSTTMFILYSMRSIEDDIENMGVGSTFKAINKDVVYNLPIPLATIELQNKFVALAEQSDKSK